MQAQNEEWHDIETDLLKEVMMWVMEKVYERFQVLNSVIRTANGTLNRLISAEKVKWINHHEWENSGSVCFDVEILDFKVLHTMFERLHSTKAYLIFAEKHQRNAASMRSETNAKHMELIEYCLSMLEDCLRAHGGTPPYQLLLKWLCSKKVLKEHKEMIVLESCRAMLDYNDVERCFWWFQRRWMPTVYAANKESVYGVFENSYYGEQLEFEEFRPMLEAAFNIHELPADSPWRDPTIVNSDVRMSDEARRLAEERDRHEEILQYLFSMNELTPEDAV